jgi:hypothetical protein
VLFGAVALRPFFAVGRRSATLPRLAVERLCEVIDRAGHLKSTAAY